MSCSPTSAADKDLTRNEDRVFREPLVGSISLQLSRGLVELLPVISDTGD
jgi:hypothetical protein